MIIFGLFAIFVLVVVPGFVGALIPIVGRLWFCVFASWWWPYREESAATLMAAALDVDEAAVNWRRHGYEQRELSSTALEAKIKTSFDGELTLCIAGSPVPLTVWDVFVLGFAVEDWRARRDEADRELADQRAVTNAKRWRKSERAGE